MFDVVNTALAFRLAFHMVSSSHLFYETYSYLCRQDTLSSSDHGIAR
jgi:hypothetical protein